MAMSQWTVVDTFDCAIPSEPIEWTTSGLIGIGQGPFMVQIEAIKRPRSC